MENFNSRVTKVPGNFRSQGTKVLGNFRSQRTKVPGNEKSRERKFPIGTIRSWERKVLGTKSRYRPVTGYGTNYFNSCDLSLLWHITNVSYIRPQNPNTDSNYKNVISTKSGKHVNKQQTNQKQLPSSVFTVR